MHKVLGDNKYQQKGENQQNNIMHNNMVFGHLKIGFPDFFQSLKILILGKIVYESGKR